MFICIKIKADTAFYKGDKIILDFDTRFIYQDGMRNAVAVLALKFNNDNVASRTINITSTSRYHCRLKIQKSRYKGNNRVFPRK